MDYFYPYDFINLYKSVNPLNAPDKITSLDVNACVILLANGKYLYWLYH